MNTRKSNKRLWLSLFFVLVMLLGACGAPETPVATEAPGPSETEAPVATEPPAASSISVLEWAYYEVPEMWVEFGLAHPEVDVVFNFGADDDDIFAKTLAGSGEDIMHFYTPYLQFYVDEGLIQPIDTSRMENWDSVPDGFKESCTIDGVVYCVPWDWGFTSVLYRTDMIPEGVDSLTTLFDPAYSGHISLFDCAYCSVEMVTYILGYDIQNLTEAQLEEIKQMLIEQRDLNLFYWVDEPTLEAGFTSGDVWAAYAWNGAYYRLLSAGVPVAYADPVEGRNSWIGQYGISANTANYDLALEFLDGKLGEQTAMHLLVDYAYGHVVPDFFSFVTDPLLIQALSLDDPSILDRTNFTRPISAELRDLFVQLWAEVKAAP